MLATSDWHHTAIILVVLNNIILNNQQSLGISLPFRAGLSRPGAPGKATQRQAHWPIGSHGQRRGYGHRGC